MRWAAELSTCGNDRVDGACYRCHHAMEDLAMSECSDTANREGVLEPRPCRSRAALTTTRSVLDQARERLAMIVEPVAAGNQLEARNRLAPQFVVRRKLRALMRSLNANNSTRPFATLEAQRTCSATPSSTLHRTYAGEADGADSRVDDEQRKLVTVSAPTWPGGRP